MTDTYPPDRIGGVGEVVASLRDAYRRKGHEVTVYTTGTAADREEGIVRLGASPALFGGASLLLPLRFRSLDLLHIHQASAPGIYLARAALGNRRPLLITTFHASSREEAWQVRGRILPDGIRVRPVLREYLYKYFTGPLHALADRIAVRLSDAITAVSRPGLRECERMGGDPPAGFRWIPNGVDSNRFRPGGGKAVRERLGLNGAPILLFVGAFRMRKGLHDLLAALREIRRTRSDVRLLVVGSGRGYEKPLLEFSRRLGVEDRIVLSGHVRNCDLPPYYDAADAVLIPSLFEGLPLVLLEAMATARPVVATRVGGIPGVVEDRVTGHLVEPGDPIAMARRVEEIVGDPKRAARLGEEARRRVKSLYSWERVADRYLAILEDLAT
ncbi:MAG: glycosyltransferase family 4 protein [Planctomycetota bacterium]|nr:glycosyltransferase family 4 protein [Planctomycetota bacterium]